MAAEAEASTARGGDEAKVDGLLAGVDGALQRNSYIQCGLIIRSDYLGKPFDARELVARGESHEYLTGAYVFSPRAVS